MIAKMMVVVLLAVMGMAMSGWAQGSLTPPVGPVAADYVMTALVQLNWMSLKWLQKGENLLHKVTFDYNQ